ncbi:MULTISPECIES: DNA replication terminus site-binding protein [Cobetia]|uniref:DNA replication terminus site-binding protein n=1 Tax=Cobetia TaxID=204286 RepID=UPI0015835CA0|nr:MULTISPECIES: DNA replication terminus site-binding protein [Cobetia]MDI4660495.1 DNA replication terminus site-binding protein [Cobetia sp. BMC6]MDL2189988.1 DNA replication terminus site-binding protein [Cobetia sp. LC6]NUJ54871.1 DNA replication terminus site-binding protein [Cobetia marina]
MPEYQLMARIEAAFDTQISAADQVITAVREENSTLWRLDGVSADSEWLSQALQDVWYQDGQDGRVTRPYLGVVAAGPTVIERVAALNAAKEQLAELFAELREKYPDQLAELKAILPFRHPGLNQHLRGDGLARLHLKQCWRRVPVAEAPVARVRFAWYSSGRSIQRVSVAECEALLLKLDTEAEHVRLQLKLLAGLPSDEILARIQPQAPLMRANLFYREPVMREDGELRTRRALNVSLPLFLPHDDLRLPALNQPSPTPPTERTRARRGDVRIEDTPFLKSLRVHRYR